jgi:hypothetical protein
MMAEALFERIEARGFREVQLHLTDSAIAHGFGAVIPEKLGISVNGRGERSQPFTIPIRVEVTSAAWSYAQSQARTA